MAFRRVSLSLIGVLALLAINGCGHNDKIRQTLRNNVATVDNYPQLLAVYQPWFGSPEHINVGYSTQDPAVLEKQISQAKNFGISAFVVDWYGKEKPYFDHSYALLQSVAAKKDFKVALMYDEPEGDPASSTNDAILALDYAYKSYIGPEAANREAYLSYNGRPVIFVWPRSKKTDWSIVRKHVEAWERPPVLINRFSDTATGPPHKDSFDGFYAWVDAGEKGWTADGSNWGQAYLDNFYKKMTTTLTDKIAVGAAWPGFNDAKASWGQGRKMDPRCGQTFRDTLRQYHRYFSSENPLPFLLVETWNDYEEGTAIERGIDTCPKG